ncbi:MAG: alpha/beta hydrolase [Phycisphaeraceae bacterium]|nr:MAG: alpha/beta hydrolase [Phycisphaeraceae bacterium]
MRTLIACLILGVLAPAWAHAQEAAADADLGSVPFAPITQIERVGTGPIELVLIPEIACDAASWRPFMERNADRYTMVVVTVPGFGGTAPPTEPAKVVLVEDGRMRTPWVDNAVGAVLDVIEREGLDRPVLVGHSLGALIGYRIAHEHPDAISGLVAVDGAPATLIYSKPLPIEERTGIVRTRFLPQLSRLDDAGWAMRLGELIRTGVQDDARAEELVAVAERTSKEVGVRYMVEMYGIDLTDRLREIHTPVLAVAAAGDVPVSRVRGLDRLRATWYSHVAGLRDLELVFVDDSRHFVMDDAPEAFDRLVQQFVERAAGDEGDDRTDG